MENQASISLEVDSKCRSHALKLSHICLQTICSCSRKLCERCLTEHEEEHPNTTILTFQNYYNKINMETEIFQRQYRFLVDKKLNPAQSIIGLNDKFNEFSKTQVYVLENSMKFLNEETKMLIRQISQKQLQFTTAYQKLNCQRKIAHVKFFRQAQAKGLVDYCIRLYNQSGWNTFRNKMQKMMNFKDSIIKFLQKTGNYGKNSQEFIKTNSIKGQLSIRQSISQLILSSQGSKKSTENKSKNSQNSVQKRKRAKTIFGRN